MPSCPLCSPGVPFEVDADSTLQQVWQPKLPDTRATSPSHRHPVSHALFRASVHVL